jgi:protein arginine kinase activator
MICERCGKKEASLEYREVIRGPEGERTKIMRLCWRCFEELCLYPQDIPKGGREMKGDFGSKRRSLSCPRCGLRKSEFLKFKVLGCPACYETFRDILIPMIREYHGHVEHVGKGLSRPIKASLLRKRIKRLKEELKKAVRRESYGEAARIRDEIRKIEALYRPMEGV